MTKSMTGFGSAVHDDAVCSVTAEIRSVNNKYFNLRCRLPGRLTALEPKIETALRRRIKRGSVDLFLRVDMKSPTVEWIINDGLLDEYLSAAERLGKGRGVSSEPPDAVSLLALPGVVESREAAALPPRVGKAALKTVETAAGVLAEARAAEGRRLAAAIDRLRRALDRIVARIDRRAPVAARAQAKRLKERVARLLQDQTIGDDDPTLLREVAFLADRSDITEELDRLRSHLEQFDATLQGGGLVGRPLDFLIQEMGREVNTIGSKASDASIAQLVVKAKAELEKIREQVQNLE